MGRVFVTRALPEEAMTLLREAPEVSDLRVNPFDRPVSRDELLAGVRRCDCLLSQLVDWVDGEVLEANPGLRVVANYAVGFNNVDVVAATRLGIPVTNTPGVLTETTADLTLALLLAVARRLGEAERFLRAGRWKDWSPTLLLGSDVHGKTLGIVGLGRIGAAVARRAAAFGMTILYANRTPRAAPVGVSAEQVTLDEVLRRSDFVTVHVPLSSDTHHLLGAAAFRAMKPTAFVINTSRGPVLDEAALVAALEAGELAGAALDVFEEEPHVHPGLLAREDVVLVPHVGSATRETRLAMARIAIENVLDVLRGQRPRTCVNPEVLSRTAGRGPNPG